MDLFKENSFKTHSLATNYPIRALVIRYQVFGSPQEIEIGDFRWLFHIAHKALAFSFQRSTSLSITKAVHNIGKSSVLNLRLHRTMENQFPNF